MSNKDDTNDPVGRPTPGASDTRGLSSKDTARASKAGVNRTIRYHSDFKVPWADYIIPVSAATTGLLVGFAAPQLLAGTGVLAMVKAVALGSAAGFVSWVVNYHAIRQGTVLAASGVKTGAIVSIASVVITGGAAFAFSYAGVTLPRVDALAYDEHGCSKTWLKNNALSMAIHMMKNKTRRASCVSSDETSMAREG